MIILASNSPRRKELLQQIGVAFSVKTSNYEEEKENSSLPEYFVIKQALGKALDVASGEKGRWVLGADTIVVFNGKILGKPKDKKDAKRMLSFLSGKKHVVMTGVALVKDKKIFTELSKTTVWFREMSAEEIDNYIETGESLDKAGAYGIQGRGAIFVNKINGSYSNVVGLPIEKVLILLKKARINWFEKNNDKRFN